MFYSKKTRDVHVAYWST